MKKLILLGLNELNIDFVKYYANKGYLPNFNYVLTQYGYKETLSEAKYELLEPWIQWVTIHTGLTYEQHQVFRLGDITEREDLKQIWEILEQKGFSVGAISPFNADNRLNNPKFFAPDPWTTAKPAGPNYLINASEAVSQAVNDNANKKITLKSILSILVAISKAVPLSRLKNYIRAALNIRKVGSRALILDNLLADIFLYEWKKNKPDFSSLFLNTGAHFQHHYMFNSAAYKGVLKNPEWYCPSNQDPLFSILKEYDEIIGKLLKLDVRLIIATGLHQKPHEHLTYYWRLKELKTFLKRIGVNNYIEILPRMSRDFLINFSTNEAAAQAQNILNSFTSENDSENIFAVDNRGKSLFVELIYPHNIDDDFKIKNSDLVIERFKDHVAFVAIKNGEHDGIGYYIDSEKQSSTETIELNQIFQKMLGNFVKSKKTETV